MSVLDGVLNFLKLTHEAHRVERVARIPGQNRYGNMVEHSWSLAMLAWYLIDTQKLPLNKDLVLRYALCHDLVESYAGDTFIFDKKAREDKGEREQQAREKIAADHPEFTDLIKTMEAYELRKDAESKFLYALDKMIDPLDTYLENGLLWKELNITLEMETDYKDAKVCSHPEIYEMLYKPLWKLLEEREEELFGPRKKSE